jgi:putative endonuclease
MERGGYVYIMTNKNNTTVYVGVTSDLLARVTEHREKKYSTGFTAKYNVSKLVYYEGFFSMQERSKLK